MKKKREKKMELARVRRWLYTLGDGLCTSLVGLESFSRQWGFCSSVWSLEGR